ncbi:MAG: (5-formylfuran-3-yl)methyl phosphate synthase [Elusimicrobiota bacterium]|jgi:hypothetical protein
MRRERPGPSLLVSPRDLSEAGAAALGGADIIDMKNPAEGSLGANFPWAIAGVVSRLKRRGLRFSAAIGDFPDLPGSAALAARGAALCGVDFVKVGLRGSDTPARARPFLRAFSRAVREASPRAVPVAAAYGDWRRIRGLRPLELVAAARGSGVGMLMLDTAVKDGKSLFDHLTARELAGFIRACRRAGLRSALAGSLRVEEVARVRLLGADVVGVRGAACARHDRRGRIDARRVAALVRAAKG